MINQKEINMLIYKSWHRGCKETDILLGDFAKACILTLNSEEIAVYKELLEENDWDIYEWILSENTTVPAKYKNIIQKIIQFNLANTSKI